MNKPALQIKSPAPPDKSATLHDQLVATGQALSKEQMRTFLLSIVAPDGHMQAACKGEIAFTSAHVSELWVDADTRGQGMGTKLLGAAEAHARNHDCTRIHLETRNESARRLYERCGYHVFGRLHRYDGDQAFYYMEKKL